MWQDEQVKFLLLVPSQQQLISGPKRCFNYLWKKILFIYSNCLSYWSLDVTKWTGEIFVACPISTTAYLRSKKMFPLLMKENTFYLLQLSTFWELRYVFLRCDKMNRWNLWCLSDLSVLKVLVYVWRKYLLFTPTVYLFGAEIFIAEMWQASKYWIIVILKIWKFVDQISYKFLTVILEVGCLVMCVVIIFKVYFIQLSQEQGRKRCEGRDKDREERQTEKGHYLQ